MTKEQLKLWRCKNKLTQKALGELFDLTKNTIQNYEYGITKIPKTVELSCNLMDLKWNCQDASF